MRSHIVAVVLSTAVVFASGALVAAAPTTIESSATATSRATRIDNATQIDPLPAPPTARYRVTFVSEWTSASHPTTLPANAHFSPIVVAAHGQAKDLIDVGGLATAGIEAMAETGSTSTLRAELGGDSSVTSVKVGTTIFGAGSQSFELTLAKDSPFVSLVSMLAPTPDWFAGVAGQSMFDDGDWLDQIAVDLEPYDAGTDSGTTFTSPNANTNPPQPIGGPRDASFVAAAAEARFGFVTIQRLS